MWTSEWAHVETLLFVVIFLNYTKGLLFCEWKTNATTSHQNPMFTQWEYSRHQTKAAMQLKLKFNIINLIIVHNYLTVLRTGFKGWYCNWLWIIKKHAEKIMLPGWWWVTSVSHPGSRLWEQMAPVTINESWGMGMETVLVVSMWGRIMTTRLTMCQPVAKHSAHIISLNLYNNSRG